ncbi:magnesium/cobalt transporter CorA [Luedemannella helvata]|uniref:Magnesium transport protein CorA n=2 Tax=Luedemannella helvata TaxID=349315 RepID=A0ABN2K538_9ACTN
MADAEQTHGPAINLGRALSAPMRAVTRMFGQPAASRTEPKTPAPGRSAIVDCALYVRGKRQPGQWGYREALAAARKRSDAFVWLGLHDPQVAELEDIGEVFELDQFAVEDILHRAHQRPKIEQYGDMTFAVLRTARYMEHEKLTEATEVVETGHMMLFVGEHFVITVRLGEAARLAPVRAELEARPDLLALGPWAVVYAIADCVVDAYLDVATMVEADIDEVETSVFDRDAHERIARVYHLKREMVEFKRAVLPLQRPLAWLVEGRLGEVSPEIRRYFRDVNDHLLKVVEQVTSFDDLLNSILQARLAQVTVDQNNDMRKIAAWAAIAASQTAIAGIYGMNFDHMPETTWKFGYPGVLAVMFGLALWLYRMFRRSGWL